MIEILAPAGGEDSAYAAINAGADAVYLGLDRFSARSSAENFDGGNFIKICRYAHAFGVKVYAALNTVIKDCEIESFLNAAVTAWNDGADAIIVQDIFLGAYLKKNKPQIKLHLSTQAGTNNVYGAELAKQYGFDRVILSRETKLSDIERITKIIETEVFVQGALCTCFSGQCYMSSFAGGNSGNRGKCKQPCRKKYSVDRKGFEEQAYRLSLSDLCVGEEIQKFIDAGVSSFKIEGRMRRPEYVSAAVGYYKKLLCGGNADLGVLKRTFNRGNYTKGLAFGQDKSFISSAVQGHIGEFIGIVKVENAKYICKSNLKFVRGDGFKILRAGKEVGGGVFGGEVKGGFIVSSRERLKNGDKVFVTTDTSLNARLLSEKRLIPVTVCAEFSAGKAASVSVNGKKFFSAEPLERSKTSPLTVEDIKRCFSKKDGYPFEITFGEVKSDGAFMATSALNAFRRGTFSDFYESLAKSDNEKISADFKLPEITAAENAGIAVICTDLKDVRADIGILKPFNYSDDPAPLMQGFTGEKYLFVPPFATGEELETVKRMSRYFDGIYCDSYFGLKLSEELKKPFFAGTGFNITNRVSLDGCKAKYICLSKELTAAEASPLCVGNAFYLVAGNLKVMDLIYCPFGKSCSGCDMRSVYTLTDCDGRAFPLRRYRTSECRFEVYNCADLVAKGTVGGKLYDFTLEDAAQTIKIAKNLSALKDKFKNYTRGHSVTGIY